MLINLYRLGFKKRDAKSLTKQLTAAVSLFFRENDNAKFNYAMQKMHEIII